MVKAEGRIITQQYGDGDDTQLVRLESWLNSTVCAQAFRMFKTTIRVHLTAPELPIPSTIGIAKVKR